MEVLGGEPQKGSVSDTPKTNVQKIALKLIGQHYNSRHPFFNKEVPCP